ncbi:MAG: MFS transporter [Victivallaceae bacterium]
MGVEKILHAINPHTWRFNDDGTPKSWKVGTLTYSFGGLAFIFTILLIGDMIWAFRERSVSTVARLVFQKHGASDFVNGILIASIPSAIGLGLVPIISFHSDRFRSRFGRRIPYLFVTTPIVVAGMVGMAYSEKVGHWLQLETLGIPNSTLMLLGVFWTLFEFGVIAANAVFTALINDVVPREVMGRFYGLFRMVSLAVGIVFNWWLLEPSRNHYTLLFVGIGLLYGIGFAVLCFLVKEGDYPAPPAGERKGFFANFKTYFVECYSKPYYLLVFFFFMMAGKVFVPIGTYSVLYAKTFTNDLTAYGRCVAISFGISFVLSFFLGMLADKYHPLRCAIVTMGVYGVTTLVSGYLIKDQFTFLVAEIIFCVMSGTYFTLTMSLPMRLYPRGRFAQFASAGGLIGGITQIVTVPIVGKILDLTGSNYKLIFYMSGGLAFLAMLAGVWLYREFDRRGGVKSYVAPE